MDQAQSDEKAVYVENKPKLEGGLKEIKLAFRILNDYYAKADKAHSSSDGAGRGIIGMLKVIESDFTKGLAEMVAAKQTAAASFEKKNQENAIEKTTRTSSNHRSKLTWGTRCRLGASCRLGARCRLGAMCITWIMYQDMCAIKVVRNTVLNYSTVGPSATIQDCKLNDWTKQACTTSCDDSCDPSQPFKCGGWAQMTRSVVGQPDKYGVKCPVFDKYMRCGQYHCLIGCANVYVARLVEVHCRT